MISKSEVVRIDNINKQVAPQSVVLVMVCVYIFLAIERPWESISYLQGIPIERPFAILMIVVAFLAGKFRIVSSPTNKWVYGLMALHFVLAPFAFYPSSAVNQGFEYSKMVLFYLLMLSVADNEESLKLLIKVYVFTMMFYMIHSLWEYHNGSYVWRMGISRMIGVDDTYGDSNTFGASVVFSLPFVYALLRTETITWHRRLYYVYFVIAVVCVVLTGSRSAFVVFLFLNLLWVVSQKGKRKIAILAVAIFAVFFIWTFMPVEKQNRIRTLWDKDAGPKSALTSAEGRLDGLVVSWKMFKQAPFTGVGAGGENFIGYRLANQIDEADHRSASQAHNLYGEVLAEFGVFGVMLFVGLIFSIRKCALFVWRSEAIQVIKKTDFCYWLSCAVIATLLLLLLSGLAGHSFYRPLWLWLAAWSGALLNIVKQKNTLVQGG